MLTLAWLLFWAKAHVTQGLGWENSEWKTYREQSYMMKQNNRTVSLNTDYKHQNVPGFHLRALRAAVDFVKFCTFFCIFQISYNK